MVVVIVLVLLKFFGKYTEVVAVAVAVVDVDVVFIVNVVVDAKDAAIRLEFEVIVVVFPQ
jgi:hypothetical protein